MRLHSHTNPPEVMRRTFDVNFFDAVEPTWAALPLMQRRRRGHIVMISSLSAQVPLSAGGAYAASKSALDACEGILARLVEEPRLSSGPYRVANR